MSELSDQGPQDRPAEDAERPDVRDAMAVYSAEGQGDDETGNDAAAGAAVEPGSSTAEGDREPHGPA